MLAQRIGLRLSQSELSLTPSIEDYSWDGNVKFTNINWLGRSNDITIYMDDAVSEALRDQCKFRVAVLSEPQAWIPAAYRSAILGRSKFDVIMTYDDTLLKLGSPFTPFICAGTLASRESIFEPLPPKSDLISIALSPKKKLPGHKLRHRVLLRLRDREGFKIEGFGAGASKPYVDALEPYKTHHYTFAIENHRAEYYLTEKLIEPLLCKTVPIYWGGESAAKELFNPLGIIFAKNYKELVEAASMISVADYDSRKLAIEQNFEIARGLISKEANLLAQITREMKPSDECAESRLSTAEWLSSVPRPVERYPLAPSSSLKCRARNLQRARFGSWLSFVSALITVKVPSPLRMLRYLRL